MHVGEALLHARHDVIGMNFVFQIEAAVVFHADELQKDLRNGKLPFPDRNLAVARFHWIRIMRVGEILAVDIKHARAGLRHRFHDIDTGARGVPDIYAAADARIHVLYGCKDPLWSWEMLV